jgi:hypothetical protein
VELAQTHGVRGEINAAVVSTTLLYRSTNLLEGFGGQRQCRRTLDSRSLPARRFRQRYKSVCKPFAGFAANTRVVENQRAIKIGTAAQHSARRPSPAERHAASARRRQHRCLRSRPAAPAPARAPAGSAGPPPLAVQREEDRDRGRPAGGRRRALQDRATVGRRRDLRPRLRRRRVSFHAHAASGCMLEINHDRSMALDVCVCSVKC